MAVLLLFLHVRFSFGARMSSCLVSDGNNLCCTGGQMGEREWEKRGGNHG